MQVTLSHHSQFIVNLTAASIRWGLEDLALRLRDAGGKKNIDVRVASDVTKTHNDFLPNVHAELIEGMGGGEKNKQKKKQGCRRNSYSSCWGKKPQRVYSSAAPYRNWQPDL